MCKRMNAKTFKVNEFLEIQHEILSTIDELMQINFLF